MVTKRHEDHPHQNSFQVKSKRNHYPSNFRPCTDIYLALKHAPLMRKLSRECPQRKEPVEYKETPLARTSQGSCESSPKITKKITE